MGTHKNIALSKFPKQGSMLGRDVKVCFHYNAGLNIFGTVVRHDAEAPHRMLIQLEDQRVIEAAECHYQPAEGYGDPDAPWVTRGSDADVTYRLNAAPVTADERKEYPTYTVLHDYEDPKAFGGRGGWTVGVFLKLRPVVVPGDHNSFEAETGLRVVDNRVLDYKGDPVPEGIVVLNALEFNARVMVPDMKFEFESETLLNSYLAWAWSIGAVEDDDFVRITEARL